MIIDDIIELDINKKLIYRPKYDSKYKNKVFTVVDTYNSTTIRDYEDDEGDIQEEEIDIKIVELKPLYGSEDLVTIEIYLEDYCYDVSDSIDIHCFEVVSDMSLKLIEIKD